MQKERTLDRRSFLKGSFAAAAAAALPAALMTGCASQDAAGTQDTASGKPLGEAERAAAIVDPAYMGASTNYCGQEVVVGVGKQGQIANQKMIDHHANFEPHLVKVTDRIYTAVGNALSNSTMIIGDTGIIVVDTGECKETAQLDLDLFRTVTDLPVVAVIYSHTHYCGGTQTYVAADNPDGIPIIAQERFMEGLVSPITEKSGFYVDRGFTMFGSYLDFEGEDGSVGGGTGAFFVNPHVKNPTPGFVAPNTLIPVAEYVTEMTIDGLTFHFFPTTADSFENINLYVVEEDTVIANQLWCVFWNMYTLRGEAYRDPVNSIRCIDDLIDLEPTNLVSVHGLPVLGREDVAREMELYRDGVQFVYDQTIRHMNKGLAPDDIVAAVKIPEFLVSSQITKPLYGEIEHYVRGVYSGLVGWFGNDPLELHPVSKAFSSAKIVEAMGGATAVVEEAQRVLEDNQYAWAATLATYVLDADVSHEGAKRVKAQAFRKMAQVTEATNTRHWYLTSAHELEGTLNKAEGPSWVTKDKLAAAPRTYLLDTMRVGIVPEKAEGVEASLAITYTDEGVTNTMLVRHCIGKVVEGRFGTPDAELQMGYPTMLSLAVREKTLEECLLSGEVTLVGSKEALDLILGLCEVEL